MAGTLASLLIKLGLDASEVAKGADQAQASIGRFGSGAGQAMKIAGGLIGGGLGLAAKGALEMEDRAAAFQAETGASAEEARHFADVVNAASGSSLVAMDDIAQSATKIRTDLGLTGAAADAALPKFLAYERATGQGADAVLAFDDILDNWNLTAEDAGGIMDQLIVSHQRYGGSIADNQKTLAALAPAMQAANMQIDDGIALLGLFGAKGLDANVASAAFSKALTKVKSPEELQALITDISNTEDPFERASKAADLFGARAGAKLANALGGANLDDYKVGIEDAAGATEKAADALDSTFTSRLKEALNTGRALLRGFGMEVGPILTGAASGISFAKALGLDKPLGSVWKKVAASAPVKAAIAAAGGIAGGIYARAVAAGQKLSSAISGMWSKVTDGASKAGGIAGGKFGAAFKVAAIAGLAVVIAEELAQLGEVRQANVEQSAKITEGMQKLLDSAPTRAEAEAKLAALKAIPGELNGIQGAVYAAADFGKGNVLGSVVDGLFGANPAQVLDTQVADLEAYIAGLPAEVAPAATAAGAGIGDKLGQGVQQGVGNAAATVRRTGRQLSAAVAASAAPISAAWDKVTNALSKGPKIESMGKRMADAAKAVRYNTRQLARALKVGDAVTAGEYAQRLQDAKAARAALKKNASQVLTDAGQILGRQRAMSRKTHKGMTADVSREAKRAARIAIREGKRQAAGPVKALNEKQPALATAAETAATTVATPLKAAAADATSWGAHLGSNFAAGIGSSYGEVLRQADALGGAVRSRLAFSHPPRKGPLSKIRSWGPHMVVQWLQPIRRHVRDAERTGDRLAAAMDPGRRRHGGVRWSAAGQRGQARGRSMDLLQGARIGGDVHFHIGTLIADDRGLDQLERRMERRRRVKGRTPTRYNDPG